MKLLVKVLLVLTLVFNMFPMDSFYVQAKEREGMYYSDIKDYISSQIKTELKKYDVNDAVDRAANALVTHGLTQNGKKLSVGKGHALTAILYNSNMAYDMILENCTGAINAIQNMSLEAVPYIHATFYWSKEPHYYSYVKSSNEHKYQTRDYDFTSIDYTGKFHEYDDALIWMGGCVNMKMSVIYASVSDLEIKYKISCTMYDFFDFDTSRGSGFTKFISGIGMLLLKEFDWESTIDFELTVPNTCTHQTNDYHFTYNKGTELITSDTNGYQKNNVKTVKSSNGKVAYYELADTVSLLHDKPWVMEFDLINTNQITFAPIRSFICLPIYTLRYRDYTIISAFKNIPLSPTEMDKNNTSHQNRLHFYGKQLNRSFKYNRDVLYTYRLENVIDDNHQNTVYITVVDANSGDILVNRVPMNDYYLQDVDNTTSLIEQNSKGLVGEDFFFTYLGYAQQKFDIDYFDLRVYENGKNNEKVSFYQKVSTTKPTCTSQGYTTYECSVCGHTKKDDYVSKLGHSFTNYVSNNDATVEKDGTKTAKCDRCDTTSTITDTGSKLVVDSISIKSLPTKLEYVEGQELELDGLVVEATYTNDITEEVSNYTVTGYDKDSLGTQWLTVSYYGKSTSFAVNVIKNIKLEVEETIFINYGGTYQLNVNVIPTSSKVTYSSSNTKVATVDKKGKITAKSLGTTILTVKADNGLETTCTVTVKLKDITTKVSRSSDTSLKVSWNKVTGASGYVVYRSTSLDGEFKKIATITKGTTTSYTNSKLTNGTTYYYKVRAYRTVNGKKVYGEYSQIVGYAPLKTPSVNVSKISHDTIHVSWKTVKYAENYELYRSIDNKTYELITTTSDLGYLDENLLTGKTYYYKVKAVKDCESNLAKSAYSSYKSLKLSLDKPTLTVTNVDYTSNELRWDTIEGASMYQVYRSTKEKGTYTKVAETKDRSYVDTNVKVGTTYYYKVRAYHVNSDESKGYGSYSKIVSKKVILPKPTNVVVSRLDSKTAEITYDSVLGADGYEIYRATSKTGKYSKITTVTETSYTNTKLSNKTYYYKVRAYRVVNNKKVYSSYSSVITCKK